MVKRLPIPGSDHEDWGDILNDYLSVSHADDGTPKAGVVGTTQLQDNAVTNAKLDSGLQASLSKADSALQPAPVTGAAGSTGDAVSSAQAGIAAAYYSPEDYGCATSASATTNDAAIFAAINDAIANNGVVQFIGKGPYAVAKAINQDVSKFVVSGNKTTLSVDDSFSGAYFWSLYSNASYPYNGNLGTAIEGIILTGKVLGTTPLATSAIRIGHDTYKENSLFSIENVYIQGFATGISFTHNSWRVRIINCRVTGGTAISVNPGLVNCGENMLIKNCMFESYNPHIHICTGEWNFINCSFDSTHLHMDGDATVRLEMCHIEPHNVYPAIMLNHPQALMVIINSSLIIDPAVTINSAVFDVISTNTTRGLVIRDLDMIQSAKYTPQVNSKNCLLVSGGGRVDMQGFAGYVNGYGFAIAASNNLIYNGDGEKGSTVGWTTFASYGGTSTFTADSSVHKYGAYSLRLTTSGSSIYVGQIVPCKAGQWVFAQCWNKLTVSSGSGSTSIEIDFLNSKGDIILTTGYINITTTTYWTCRRQISGTNPVAPPGTAAARLYIAVVGSANTTAWYDDVILNVA